MDIVGGSLAQEMGSVDEEFQLLSTSQENGAKLTCETSKCFSEIWLDCPSDGRREERKFISENAARDGDFAQRISTEEKGPCETILTPKELWSDSESVNATWLPGNGSITTTTAAAATTAATPPLLSSPSLSKADEALCDSSGSYHTAVCSVTLDNVSDDSGPFEAIEDLPTDSAAEGDQGAGRPDVNPPSEQGSSKVPELGGSSPQRPPGPQCGRPEGDGEGLDGTWEGTACGGVGEWEPCEWNGEMESCHSDGGNQLGLDSGCEEERGTSDGNRSSGCEVAPGWLEGRGVSFVDVASDSCSLTTSSNSTGLAAISGSPKHDPWVGNRRGKGSQRQQVQLPISPENSQARRGCRGAGDQRLEKNTLEQAGFHPHPQTPEEMFRGDSASEDRRKSYHRARCERAPAYCVSDTSSADENDIEVRRLTSLAFRSLSCPGDGYFDISNCGTDTGLSSSMSEDGNADTDMRSTYRESGHCPIVSERARWDLSPNDNARFTPSPDSGECNKEMSDDAFDRMQFECVDVMMESQEGKGGKTASRTVPKRQIQLKKRERYKLKGFPMGGDADRPTGLEVRPGHGQEEMAGPSGNVRENSTATESARTDTTVRGREDNNNNHKRLPRASLAGDSVTKSKLASCLITNVILKKMQFERGLKVKPGKDSNSTLAHVKDSEFRDNASKQGQSRGSSSGSETWVTAEILTENTGSKSPDAKWIPTLKDVCSTGEPNPSSGERGGNGTCHEKAELRNWKESNRDGQIDRDHDFLAQERLRPAVIPSGRVPAKQGDDNDKLHASQGKRADCFAKRAVRTWESGRSTSSENSPFHQKTSRVLLSKRKVSDIMFTSKSPGIILTPPSVSEKQTEGKGSGSVSKTRPLLTLCRSGAEEEQVKVMQSDMGERISTEGKTEGPTHHVRSVRKLVGDQCDVSTLAAHKSELNEPKSVSETQNTADAGNLKQRRKSLGATTGSGYGERKSESTFRVHGPASELESVSLAASLNHSSQWNQSEPAVRSRALPPMVIECRSINRKINRDNNICLSVAEKYWACMGGKESSKVFSSDLKLPIPSDKREKRRIATCETVNPIRCVTAKEDLAHFSKAENSERRIQALSISSNPGSESSLRKNLCERNSCDRGEDENTHPACQVLTNETTDLRPEKEKQSALVPLTTKLANSGTTIKDVSLFGKVEPFGEFANQLENQNQKISTASSSTEGGAQITNCKGEERSEGSRNLQIPSQPSEHSTSTEGIVNRLQANDTLQKALGRKLEAEDQLSRILCLEKNANVETPDGKSIPQSAIEVESENPDVLVSKSVVEQTSVSPQRDKVINRTTEIQSQPFGNQSSDDKENQTPARKRRHQGDVVVRPEISGKQVEDGTCDAEGDRASPHTVEEKIKHGVGLEEEDRFLGNSTLDRTNGNSPSIGKEEAERPMAFGLDDGSEAGAHSILNRGNVNLSSRREGHEIEEHSDLDNETSPLGTGSSICEEVKPLSEESKRNGMAGANYLLGNTVSTETGDIRAESELQVGLRGEDKLDQHCVGNSGGVVMSQAKSKGKEDTMEPIAQTGQEEAEKTQSPVNSGVRFISEFQPIKDPCAVPVILGEVGEQSPPRSEGSEMGIEGNSLLPEPNPFPRGAADSQYSGRQTLRAGESSCCEESVDNLTSARAFEAETLCDRSVFSPGVRRATQGKPPWVVSPPTGYHGNLHPPGNYSVGFFTGKNPVQGRHPSLEAKSTPEASAQCEAMFSSNAVNYLTIPAQVSPSPSPSSFVPLIANSPQFQHGWEIPLPHTAGSQTLPLHFLPEHRPLVAFSPHHCFVSPRPSDPVWPPQSVPFLPPPKSLDVEENSPKLPLSSPVVDSHHHCSLFPFPPVQNKMLVDPESGKYYLVQAPVRSPRKMLLDPETGHYVEVIIPQQNYYQDRFSPYVLSPEVLRSPYMPGLQYPVMSMASTVVSPGQTPLREAGVRVDNSPKPSHKYDGQKNQLSESNCIESLYYLPTGVTANPCPTQTSRQLVSMHSPRSKSHIKVTEDSTLILASQQSQGLSTLASCRTPTSFAVEQEQK